MASSLTCLLTHSLTHSRTHSPTHPPTHSLTHSLTHSPTNQVSRCLTIHHDVHHPSIHTLQHSTQAHTTQTATHKKHTTRSNTQHPLTYLLPPSASSLAHSHARPNSCGCSLARSLSKLFERDSHSKPSSTHSLARKLPATTTAIRQALGIQRERA